jgi:hypothetical protein
MKIRPVGAGLFHAHEDMTKLTVAFRNFVNVPKTCQHKQYFTSYRMYGTVLQYGDQLPFSARTKYRRSSCIHRDFTACTGKLKLIQEF